MINNITLNILKIPVNHQRIIIKYLRESLLNIKKVIIKYH